MLDKLRLLSKDSKAVNAFIKSKGCIYGNRWLFSSVNNTEFNYNSKYLFEYVWKNHPEIEPFYVINDEDKREKLNKKYRGNMFINTLTDEGLKLALSCKTWFTSAGLPVYSTDLSRYYDIINLWHGIPLKKIALLDKNLNFFSRMMFKKMFSDNYKYVLTSSETMIPVMKKSFGVNESKIRVWGQPRCDLLYKEQSAAEILAKLYGRKIEFKKLILYAPTYRDWEGTKLFPFHDYDAAILNQYLQGSGTLILVKAHLSERADFSSYYSENILPLTMSEDIMDILNIFDMLITDYSSIYIDYLKLDRGIVFLPYDREIYIRGRGLNFNFDEVTPGAKPKDQQEFINALKGVEDDYYSMKRQEVLRIMDETKGEVSELICQKILGEMRET